MKSPKMFVTLLSVLMGVATGSLSGAPSGKISQITHTKEEPASRNKEFESFVKTEAKSFYKTGTFRELCEVLNQYETAPAGLLKYGLSEQQKFFINFEEVRNQLINLHNNEANFWIYWLSIKSESIKGIWSGIQHDEAPVPVTEKVEVMTVIQVHGY